jgi:hypothetical protein
LPAQHGDSSRNLDGRFDPLSPVTTTAVEAEVGEPMRLEALDWTGGQITDDPLGR